ncbi:E3 ubiquitin-protein ligase RNF26 [Narcine bancroftii]|uniref:E3 ubiquitin-protein ligase RNF26 n=1 Tax=Narcine bancroftii TaxID=1343680 RepID=UPI00383129F4
MAGLVIGLISGLGCALDLLCFLLDLNFWLVSTTVASVSALLHLMHCIPATAAYVLGLCSNLLLLLVLGVAELCHYGLQLVLGLLRAVCGLAESLKMVGHLLSYLGLRGREELQRGLATTVCSGHLLLKQLWDAAAILASLAAYLVNTIINMFLIGTQNILSVAAVLGHPLVKATEALAFILTYLSSTVLGNVILLWTPCQFVIEVLISLIRVLADVLLLNLYGLAIVFIIICSATVFANPEIILRIVNQVTYHLNAAPNFNWVRRVTLHICRLVVANGQLIVNSETWRMYSQQLQRLNPGHVNFRLLDQIGQIQLYPVRNLDEQTAVVQQPVNQVEPTDSNPVEGAGNSIGEQLMVVAETSAHGPESGDGPLQPAASVDKKAIDPVENELWMLLKEQEEKKKCVICQDQAKSVLLLPCRHLCLCQGCTGILLQQPIYRRNCPLCRQMILQTLDVYF